MIIFIYRLGEVLLLLQVGFDGCGEGQVVYVVVTNVFENHKSTGMLQGLNFLVATDGVQQGDRGRRLARTVRT